MKIKAAITREVNAPFVIEEVDLAEPKIGQVLVKVVACGVCHTDEGVRSNEIPSPMPIILGHEGSGIVEEIGPGVVDLKPGDKVAFSYAYCGHCPACASGHPYQCKDGGLLNAGGIMADGTTPLSQNGVPIANFFGQSSFATYSILDQNSVIKVDQDIDVALVGPLGCGIQTGAGTSLNAFKLNYSSSIAIFGVGTVGMSAIMGANVAGCKTIIAVGGNPKSLELAKELGATHTINRKEVNDVPEAIKEITDGRGLNFAVDTSGVDQMITWALDSLGSGGELGLIAASGNVDYAAAALVGFGKGIKGIYEGESIPKVFIPEMVQLYKEGRFPIDKLMTFYDFEDINQAFEDSKNGKVIKAVLRMPQ